MTQTTNQLEEKPLDYERMVYPVVLQTEAIFIELFPDAVYLDYAVVLSGLALKGHQEVHPR